MAGGVAGCADSSQARGAAGAAASSWGCSQARAARPAPLTKDKKRGKQFWHISYLIAAQRAFFFFFLIQLFVGSLCATEPDSWKDGCQQIQGYGIQDSIHDDGHAKTNMVSSELLTAKTKKKMEESFSVFFQ